MVSDDQPLQNLPHDAWARYYDYVYTSTYGAGYEAFNRISLNAINGLLQEGKKGIIDYGAGTGRLSLPLAQAGHKVIAVEQSEPMLNELVRKASAQKIDIQTKNCSIQNYNGEKADLAICVFTVLNYVSEDAQLLSIFKNIHEHLYERAQFFFDLADPVFFQHGQLPGINKINLKRRIEIIHDHDNLYTYRENCSGIFEGEAFEYKDAFALRYWKIEEVDRLLSEAGFVRIDRDFPQFASTGSTYYLYQK